MLRLLLIPGFYLLIGCLALFAHLSEAGYTHLWALRPTAGAFWFYWLLGLLAAALLLRTRANSQAQAPLPHGLAERRLGFGPWSSLLLMGLMVSSALLLLFEFRQRLFLAPPDGLGDSLLILEQVPVYTHLLGYLDSFDELLELYWHCKLYLYTATNFGWHVEDAYALLSIGAFALYGPAIFYFLIRRSLLEICLGLALLVFVPALQLFAGYVEHYTLATAWMALALLAGAFALERVGDADAGHSNQAARDVDAPPPGEKPQTALARPEIAAAVCAGFAALAVLHHSITTVILPALVYLVYELAGRRLRGMIRPGLIAAAVALPVLGGTWAWFILFAEPPLAFFDSHVSSPPVHRPGELFQPAHLRDMLNLLFIASPGALLLLAAFASGSSDLRSAGVAAAAESGRAEAQTEAIGAQPRAGRLQTFLAWIAPEAVHRFLLLATLALGGIAFVIESLIGFPADWDLLTIFQFPLNLFLFYHFRTAWRRRAAGRPILKIAAPLLLILHGFITINWIGRNAESTELSRQNVELARRNVDQSLAILRADSVFAAVRNDYPDREKTYIQVKLFFIRSRNRLQSGAGSFSPAERRDLLQRLQSSEAQFHEWMQMSPGAFEERYDPLWKAMSELNVTINAGE